MGGDADPKAVNSLACYIHERYPHFKVAWWSGRTVISSKVEKTDFDYIKIGPYIRHLGSLKSKTTNQHMLKKLPDGTFIDITSQFWKK